MIINSTIKCLIQFFILLLPIWLVILISCISKQLSHSEDTMIPENSKQIKIIPDQMKLEGDVATKANTRNKCTERWLANMPEGSIILGVNPDSCSPVDWKGGSAKFRVFLKDIYSPTIYVIKVTWPDHDGKGLHSPHQNRKGSILLDGEILWEKRTIKRNSFNDYYAAEHEPILTTIVITESKKHTLTIEVAEQTAWDLSRIELIAYPFPKSIKGIGYSPYRDCQYPGGALEPSDNNIRDDLSRLSHTSTAIRTYSATGINGKIPAMAKSMGLKVFAGAWLDGNNEKDDKEIEALIRLANTTDLDGLIIGNEYYLRHKAPSSIKYLLKRIIQVKEGTRNKNIPITTAEVSSRMFKWDGYEPEINPDYQSIINKVDFILVHIYPFWEQKPIDGAAAHAVKKYKSIQALMKEKYNNKKIIIGETGWPSNGLPNRDAIPSLKNQKRYFRDFLLLAEQEGVDYMYFDAFDELWKEEPGLVGQNWGYSYSDRTAKHSFYGVMIPSEQLFSINIDKKSPQPILKNLPINTKTFPIYTDWPIPIQLISAQYDNSKSGQKNRFIPSGYMDDINNISLFECDRINPHNGHMASRNTFSFIGNKGRGGIYWLANEKWEGPGINIYEKLNVNQGSSIILSFWARGEAGGEKVLFKVGGVDKGNDSIEYAATMGWITLTTDWRQYHIDLSNEDLSRVVGGFCWVTNKILNPDKKSITFFLDEIRYEMKEHEHLH